MSCKLWKYKIDPAKDIWPDWKDIWAEKIDICAAKKLTFERNEKLHFWADYLFTCEWMPIPLARSKIAQFSYESTLACCSLLTTGRWKKDLSRMYCFSPKIIKHWSPLNLCTSFLKHYLHVCPLPKVIYTFVRLCICSPGFWHIPF